MTEEIGWTQPLCMTCYLAWLLGCGKGPREPFASTGGGEDRCLVCGTPTRIYTRIDPKIAALYAFPLADSDQ